MPLDFAKLKQAQEWRRTDLGKLFVAYENATASAWQTDCNEGASTTRIRKCWDEADKARAEFLLAIRGF